VRRYLLTLSLFVLVAVVACAALLLWVQYSTAPFIVAGAAAPQAQAAIVPGASIISSSTLSAVLRERAVGALALYDAGMVKKILVTGDNAALSYDEVEPVGKYLEAHGVPARDVFLDHAGFDTYSSMYRAKAVFGVSSALIVSQPFHLPRAVFIARALGIDARGVEAGAGEPYVFNQLREIPATLKALFDLAVRRVPQYLGPTIPIEGSGTSTQPALPAGR
jgi:SanA protein